MKALIEKKNDLITRAEEVLETAKAETRELTEDEAAELAEIRDNVRKILETLQMAEDIAELEQMEEKDDATPTEETVAEEREEERMEKREEMERRAFEAYLRGTELRDDDVNLTKTDNGALIPETVVNYIIKKVYDICPILDRSQKFNVTGKIVIPKYPKASTGNITVNYATEFEDLVSTTGKVDSVELTGFLAGALTKVSRSLMNNSNFDIVGFVVDEMAYQIARWIEGQCLKGTYQKVEGLSGLTNVVEASSASAITLDDVISLHDAIKDEFQANAIWIMSPSTRTALRQLKSQTGYPLLNDDVSTPFGASILGKPVYVSDHMDNIGAEKTVIYYGDMRGLATKFSEDVNIQVLRERFATQHAVGVVGWLEFDAKVINEQQIAALVMAEGASS